MNMSVCWLILFAILLIVELATMGLTTIWFAGGSLIACVLALFNAPLWLQIFGFLVVFFLFCLFSLLCMLCFGALGVQSKNV